MTAIGVSVVSLLCSVLQLLYIGTILWLLRVRRRRLRLSAAKLPVQLEPSVAGGGTLTKTGYYNNFLPNSFHSVEAKDAMLAAPNATAAGETGFSYQTAHTPADSAQGSSVLNQAAFAPLHPDVGRMSFSASASQKARVDALYDEEDPFAESVPQVTSPLARAHQNSIQRQRTILEEDDDASIVLPAAATAPLARGHLGAFARNHHDDEDMQVSLDGDEPTARNVDLVVDSPTNSTDGSSHHSQDGIPLEQSRSPQRQSGGPASLEEGARTLHVSPAPFSLPQSASANNASKPSSQGASSSYMLMGDDPEPRTLRSDPPRAQQRHILHPKSSSYRADSTSVLHGVALAGEGMHAMFSSHGASAAAKRRASLNRRMAHAKAHSIGSKPSSTGPLASQSFTAGAPSSSSTGVLIPHRSQTASAAAQLDPNASPVRSKVKFADSPRDQKAAAVLRGLAAPKIGTGEEVAARASASTSPAPVNPEDVPVSAASSNGHTTSSAPANGAPQGERSALVPRERKIPSALKHRPEPLPSPPVAEQGEPMLVLPIYYKFLILQLLHCAMWCIACLALLAYGTNLVEWGSDQPGTTSNGKSWIFGLVMALLMTVHSSVLDGLLVFLAAKNVGRSSIRFATIFGGVWGILNGIAVLVVVQSVPAPSVPVSGLLPMWHPFFVRSAAALALTLYVLLAPSMCVCNARARRTDMCLKSREERALALARQQARWESRSGSSLSDYDPTRFEEDLEEEFNEEDYVDSGPSRSTWLRLAGLNLLFHFSVLLLYLMDFRSIDSVDKTWETLLMCLLAFGFVCGTPVMYWCLQRDSAYWSAEWHSALERMRADAELEDQLRKAAKEEERAQARAAGLPTPHNDREDHTTHKPLLANILSKNFFLDYNVLEYGPLLGSGGFSSVYSAKLGGQVDVAVKVLHVRDMSKEVVDQFLHEVSIVLQLVHPNVVSFYGVVFSPPDMVLVMERCRRQSLLHLIKQQKVRFTEFQAVSIGLAIADALRYIHEQDILHRDLKAANILFDMQGRPKICDFGLSEERSKIDLTRIFCGTIAYMSPEVLRSETVGKASDVYSFSIILWELLHNELAWKRGSNQKNGLNARVLVEMVAYRRARPPVKERLVDDHKRLVTATGPAPPQLATDAARIHPQAFSGDTNGNGTSSSSPPPTQQQHIPRPGLHPILVQLLRECWRDDYRRRPAFTDIVRRLTQFREMIRSQQVA